MKKSVIKLFVTFISLFTLVISNFSTVYAGSTYIGSTDVKEGGFLGIGSTTYTYRAYYDYDDIRYWYGLPLAPISYHKKNSGSFSLSITQTQSLSFSTTLQYNENIDVAAGINAVISITASKGRGVATGVTYTYSSAGSYTKNVPSSSASGYYMLAPTLTEYRCHWNKYSNNNTKYTGKTGVYFMPYGRPAVGLLYSPNNKDGSWVMY